MIRIFLIIVCILSVGAVLRPLAHTGFPFTHDGENHLARIANYAVALKQGQFPPRWAPTFWGGYGYPVFNYNYPLANILALPFLVTGLSVEATLKILLASATVLGAFGVYLALRQRVSQISALFATSAYVTFPFVFTNLYVRGAVGEILAYAAFPFAWYSLQYLSKISTKKHFFLFTLSVSFIALAHNILAMFLLPLILLGIFTVGKRKAVLFEGFLIGILMSMFFWIPALTEKSLVTLDDASITTQYELHFPTVGQLLFSPFLHGFSYPGPVDTLSFQVGGMLLVSCIVGSICVAFGKIRERLPSACLLSCIALFFLILPFSLPIWKMIPPLRYVQFPWRLIGILELMGTIVVAFAFDRSSTRMRVLLILLLIYSSISTAIKPVTSYIHYDDLYYKTYALTSTILDENRPKTLKLPPVGLLEQRPVVGNAQVAIKTWNGSHHAYLIHAPTDQEVTEPTTYFPGWQVQVDGKRVEITYAKTGGLIHFSVPIGDHRIDTRFTQSTPARRIGNTVSLVAICMFCVATFRKRRTSI